MVSNFHLMAYFLYVRDLQSLSQNLFTLEFATCAAKRTDSGLMSALAGYWIDLGQFKVTFGWECTLVQKRKSLAFSFQVTLARSSLSIGANVLSMK